MAPRNALGKVEYVATFALAKPVDMSKASRVLLYQVVNRGNGQAVANAEGDISLVSGWQGDVIPTANNQSIVVPVARKQDGSAVTGPRHRALLRCADGATTRADPPRLAGHARSRICPSDLAQPSATLTWHTRENYAGRQDAARARGARRLGVRQLRTTPWPGTPDPSRICVKDGFRAGRLYELVYTAKDPLVLGVGLAATRDIVSFFRHAQADAAGTPNPVAGASITRSASATRSPAISSAPSSISASTRTRGTASSGTVRSRGSRRARRRSTCASRCRAAPPACTSRAATASSGGRITRTRRVD